MGGAFGFNLDSICNILDMKMRSQNRTLIFYLVESMEKDFIEVPFLSSI